MVQEVQYQTITADSYAELKTKLDDQVKKNWRPISVTVKAAPERTYTVTLVASTRS
jgi:hypothetical protein